MEELFSQYHDKLYHYFLKVTNGNISDSKDLVQTVYVKLLIQQEKILEIDNIQRWIFTVARNCSRDFFRRHNVKKYLDLSNYESHDSNESDIEKQDRIDLLYHALSLLKKQYRMIIILHVFQELPHKKIASMLGISESNSRTRYHRAVKTLKSIYFKQSASLIDSYPKT